MSDFEPLVGWGVVIAASVVAGAVLAAALRLPARVAALVSSFAGGVLLAAVAFELVPDAEERAGLWLTALGLLAGARRQRRGDRRGRAARGDLDLDRALRVRRGEQPGRDGDGARVRRRLPPQLNLPKAHNG